MAPTSSQNIANKLFSLASEGKLGVDEVTKMLHAMKEQSSRSQARASEREQTQEMHDLLSRDLPQARQTQERFVTTVLQNVQLRTFDGQRRSSEEARQWISKFLHTANLSNWGPEQRLEVFSNQLAGPMNYWFKQLPSYVKQDWKAVLDTFVSRYCTDHTPARLRYYKLTQKHDESVVNYLYRLNAAAQLAGIDYRSSAQDLQEHVQQFFDSALDKALPLPFKIRHYDSVDELEDVLVQYEESQTRTGRAPSVPQQNTYKSNANNAKTDDKTQPRVNAVDTSNTQQESTDSGGTYGSGTRTRRSLRDEPSVRNVVDLVTSPDR